MSDTRDDNVATMKRLLDEAGPDGLSPEQAEQFDQAEARIRATDDIASRSAAIDAAMNRFPGVIADSAGVVETDEPGFESRRLGGAPPLRFSRAALREAYRAVVNRTATSVLGETRSVIAPAPSTIPTYATPPVSADREATRIIDRIPVQNVTSASVIFYKTSTPSSSAGFVAEGALKPESSLAYSSVQLSVRKNATWLGLSSESLSDYPAFAGVVENDLLASLEVNENNAVLNGDGTGANPLGLLLQSGILAYTPGAAEARLFSLRHAIALLRTGGAYTKPDTIVMHPSDVETMQKMVTSQGALVVSPNPLASQQSTAWGIDIIETSQIASGTALVANLASSTVAFVREGSKLVIDPYSLATSNIVRAIVEERFVVGVTRPQGLCKVTFVGTT